MSADPLFDRLADALAGRYTLVRELAQGGMATIYLATDVKWGRQVAIKVLPPATRAYLGADRFLFEVRNTAQLSHPHIVSLIEADDVDGCLFYVMEYWEGESLEDRLTRQGPLPIEEALRITAEVGDALQYAHERGLIHRDVKPGNILLSGGHAMLSDFGIAKLMVGPRDAGHKALTTPGAIVGTPEYMSPEQASGAEEVDVRTDVYSLAAVLYAMLVGRPPATGSTVQAVMVQRRSDPVRPVRALRPELSAGLEHALMRGLARRPADRPATVREFITSLSAPLPRPTPDSLAWVVFGGVAVAGIVWLVLGRHVSSPPPGMTLVPAGLYPVGGAPWRESTSVHLPAFFIDSTEVTVAAYTAYQRATGSPAPWIERPPERWPVTGVLWVEAASYCAWRGRRLPTEDEWEAAARGPHGWRFPWGDRWEEGRANADSLRDTFAVVGTDSLGRSWVGALDLAGNAWEWTGTAGSRLQGEPGHVIKGGAFDSPPENATAVFRAVMPDRRRWLQHTGFRCARDVGAGPSGSRDAK